MTQVGPKSGPVNTSSLTQVEKANTEPPKPKHRHLRTDSYSRNNNETFFEGVKPDSPANALISGGVKPEHVSKILENKNHGDKIAEALKHGAVLVAKEPATTAKSINKEALLTFEHSEELNHLRAEIEERRSKQAREDREFNLISNLIAVSSPVGAISLLATLKGLLGELKSPASIAFASSCIGPIASMAKDMALIQAKEKGSTDLARQLTEALGGPGGPIDQACQCEGPCDLPEGHIEHLTDLITDTNTTITTQEFSLINPETGETLLDEEGNELTFEHCSCDELEHEEYVTATNTAQNELEKDASESTIVFEDSRKIAGNFGRTKERKMKSEQELAKVTEEKNRVLNPKKITELAGKEASLRSIIQA